MVVVAKRWSGFFYMKLKFICIIIFLSTIWWKAFCRYKSYVFLFLWQKKHRKAAYLFTQKIAVFSWSALSSNWLVYILQLFLTWLLAKVLFFHYLSVALYARLWKTPPFFSPFGEKLLKFVFFTNVFGCDRYVWQLLCEFWNI